MTTDELKKCFIDKYNSCYAVVHKDYPESIFLYYDESVIRKMKLCQLNNIEFKKDNITGLCLFEKDYKNSYLLCDYDEIWLFFRHNYSDNYNDIQEFITSILEEIYKMKLLTPVDFPAYYQPELKEKDKMTVLKPTYDSNLDNELLKERDKMTVLTPDCFWSADQYLLKEKDKMTILKLESKR